MEAAQGPDARRDAPEDAATSARRSLKVSGGRAVWFGVRLRDVLDAAQNASVQSASRKDNRVTQKNFSSASWNRTRAPRLKCAAEPGRGERPGNRQQLSRAGQIADRLTAHARRISRTPTGATPSPAALPTASSTTAPGGARPRRCVRTRKPASPPEEGQAERLLARLSSRRKAPRKRRRVTVSANAAPRTARQGAPEEKLIEGVKALPRG